MNDTHPKAAAKHLARLRALSTIDRARILDSLVAGGRKLLEVRLRERYPAASDEEIRARVVARLYGKRFARRVLRRVPDDAD